MNDGYVNGCNHMCITSVGQFFVLNPSPPIAPRPAPPLPAAGSGPPGGCSWAHGSLPGQRERPLIHLITWDSEVGEGAGRLGRVCLDASCGGVKGKK